MLNQGIEQIFAMKESKDPPGAQDTPESGCKMPWDPETAAVDCPLGR